MTTTNLNDVTVELLGETLSFAGALTRLSETMKYLTVSLTAAKDLETKASRASDAARKTDFLVFASDTYTVASVDARNVARIFRALGNEDGARNFNGLEEEYAVKSTACLTRAEETRAKAGIR
jgi:hypothetical protein